MPILSPIACSDISLKPLSGPPGEVQLLDLEAQIEVVLFSELEANRGWR